MSRALPPGRTWFLLPIVIFLCGLDSSKHDDQPKLVWDLMRHEGGLTSVHRYLVEEKTFFGPERQGDKRSLDAEKDEGEAFATVSAYVPGALPLYRSNSDQRISYVASWVRPSDGEPMGFVFARPSAGLSPLRAICSGEASDCTLELGSVDRPSDDVIGYVFASARPARIGAYYFGMFSPQAWQRGTGRVAQGIMKFYGKNPDDQYWWVGVRDLYEGRLPDALKAEFPIAATFFQRDWSHLKPQIGWYDQSDPRTLERHIAQATSNGVSFFNFYWYWNAELDEEGLSDGLTSFLNARNGSEMDFMLSVCQHGWHLSIPAERYEQIAALLVRKYISKANYLRDGAGRRILQLCDANGIRSDGASHGSEIDLAGVERFVSSVRAEAKKTLGEQMNILVRMDAKYAKDLRRSGIFDGGTCIAPVLDRRDLSRNYALQPEWFTSVAQGWSFMPCFNERMDERPRLGIMKRPSEIFYFDQAADPKSFAAGLQALKSWMDRRRSDDMSRFLTIYAWNEWHEGGAIEPSERDGTALVREISRIFNTPTLSAAQQAGAK